MGEAERGTGREAGGIEERSGGLGGTWSLEVIDRKEMAVPIEERRSTIQETYNTIENRNGARQWVEKVAARWARMDPNQRRAVIAAMV
ncbi:MAG TPA: hypothetical protein PK156_21590 [Polyangium sp.]|nr:hypothetical protein [Polyangium sp.]